MDQFSINVDRVFFFRCFLLLFRNKIYIYMSIVCIRFLYKCLDIWKSEESRIAKVNGHQFGMSLAKLQFRCSCCKLLMYLFCFCCCCFVPMKYGVFSYVSFVCVSLNFNLTSLQCSDIAINVERFDYSLVYHQQNLRKFRKTEKKIKELDCLNVHGDRWP